MKKATLSTALFLCTAFAVFTAFTSQEPVTGLHPGNRAPDIVMRNPEGDEMKLSSLRGKVVLIDFWASWCGPCRHENPHVVRAYETYKDVKFKEGKGFTIYSVSLDSNPGHWQNAILRDNLSWPYHVSDLKGWSNAAAAQYNINSIPSNLLIDGNGIIIKKNLRGAELMSALEELAVR